MKWTGMRFIGAQSRTTYGTASEDLQGVTAVPLVVSTTNVVANKVVDTSVPLQWTLRGLLIKKRGGNLRPGQVAQWNEDWFNGRGLYRLRGTVRYPKAA